MGVTPYPPKPDALALAALVVESLDELARKPNALIWLIAATAETALYTGVTRGKRLIVLVGQKKAIAIAVRNVSGRRRWSMARR